MARRTHRRRTPGAVRGGIARDSRSVLFGGARRPPAVPVAAVVALVLLAAAALIAVLVFVRMS